MQTEHFAVNVIDGRYREKEKDQLCMHLIILFMIDFRIFKYLHLW